jgi:glycosyltransferase involved in cell wall biosynthesis
MNSKTCVIMPAHNEADSVARVIGKVRRNLPGVPIVVVDDGSSDGTSDQARRAGAITLNVPFNLGIGGAVQTGFLYAYRNGYDIALEVDSDGQHNPGYATELIKALQQTSSPVDMVIGSRFIADREYRSSPLRLFGIHVFSYLIRMVTGQQVYDSTSGFRAYNRKALAFLSRHYPADFPEPESIVMLLTSGFTIREVPVSMGQRRTGQSVVGRDLSFKALYFVLSNAIAILMSGFKIRDRND